MLEELIDSDRGRKVIYQGYGGETEEGVITSWNEPYVFVRFRNSVTPQACKREQLEFTFGSHALEKREETNG